MADDHVEFFGTRFGDSMDGDTVHAREEIRSEGGREARGGFFLLELACDKREVLVGLQGAVGLVACDGEVLPSHVCPRPEAISKGKADRPNKWLVGVGCEKLLEAVNIDGSDHFEQEWVHE